MDTIQLTMGGITLTDDENKTDDKDQTDLSRRKFLKNTGYVAGGVIGGGVIGSFFGTDMLGTKQPTEKSGTGNGADSYNRALMYFTRKKDFDVLSTATERIYPEDENGPGAIDLGVPYFIDHQLAGGYGINEREYTMGPFSEGTDYQGYQSPLKRHEIFMQGILALEKESQEAYDDAFVDLDGEEQDAILQKFEADEVKLKNVSAAYFFDQLRTATLSGVYADPLYGGNANMEGWKMKEFPGNQMTYLKEIDSKEFVEFEPKSLKDML